MNARRFLRSSVDFVKELIGEFRDDRSGLAAAAVSFYVFLSLVPVLLLAVAAFGFALHSTERAYDVLTTFLRQYSPALAERGRETIKPLLGDVIRGSHAASGLGVVVLLWAGSQAFVSLGTAINTAWGCRPRSFVIQRLLAILLLVGVGVLLFVSFGITTAAHVLEGRAHTTLGGGGAVFFGWARGFIAFVAPVAVSIATFTLIYKVVPNTRVPLSSALLGGTAAGILWELAKHAFSWYITSFASYNRIYGPLTGVVLLLLWIHYSSIVTIMGAQVAAVYYKRRR